MALALFQQNVGKIVTAKELARIPGKDGNTINHNMGRVFELRNEHGYDIINWKDKNHLGLLYLIVMIIALGLYMMQFKN